MDIIKDKNVIVTGAAQGIGMHVALELAEYGNNIIAVDIKEDILARTKEEIESRNVEFLSIKCDVSKNTDVVNCVREAIERFGKIDALMNCAGIINSSILREIEEEEWDRVMNINAKSVQFFTKEVSNHMIDNKIKGKIVNVSSQASKIGEYGNGIYCCSKAVVNMLTRVYALELAPFKINVNAVCPGYVNTEIMQSVFRNRGPIEGMTPEQYEDSLLQKVPFKRMAEPGEIAGLMIFLASDSAGYITGMTYTIAGGSLLI